MTSSDFGTLLQEQIAKVGDLPVVLWIDDQPMSVVSAEDDGGELFIHTISKDSTKGLLASRLMAIIDEIGYELEDIRAAYILDGDKDEIYVMDVSADETSHTIDLLT